jgi:decaprenylphospho-beta-D-ribofuranose 2-oxidase
MKSASNTLRAAESSFHAVSFDGNDLGRCSFQRPDRYAFFDCISATRYVIARGAGLSYAAASFGTSSVSVEMTSFDRILRFSAKERIVEVEAGMRIGNLFNFLALHGLYLAVQPGHGALSVGGCIAADVHGKNQLRDGTFLSQVESLRLFHPAHGITDLSNDRNPELFRATCGGYGSTGIIISACLRAAPIPASGIAIEVTSVADAQEIAPQLVAAAAHCDFVYSWHDCTNPSGVFGRGYLVKGRFVNLPPVRRTGPHHARSPLLSAHWRVARGVRIYNRWSTKLMNIAHERMMRNGGVRVQTLDSALFPIHGSEFYFRAFGKHGFHEYQALIPVQCFNQYMLGLRDAIRKARVPITLASAKLFAGTADLLRFSGDGICFALNFPRVAGTMEFMCDLDFLLGEVGGRPNIIKDSRLPQTTVAAAYPEYSRFRSILHAWDPGRLFRSELTDRLEL